ncbi:TetR/AcrR family transcriptional regulator [Gordonia sp. NPDC003424]
MPKVTEDYRRQRRAEVIAAARECVAAEGIPGTTIADVIDRSGLSAGVVYRAFPDRQAIIDGVVTDVLERATTRIAAALHNLPAEPHAAVARVFELAAAPPPADDAVDRRIAISAWAHAAHDPRLRVLIRTFYDDVEVTVRTHLLPALTTVLAPEKPNPDVLTRSLMAIIPGSYIVDLIQT